METGISNRLLGAFASSPIKIYSFPDYGLQRKPTRTPPEKTPPQCYPFAGQTSPFFQQGDTENEHRTQTETYART
ncbi:MAG: hypothetical protein SGI92_01530, partial [Bryobacteraceae bacterium]|nr:hypothetical protein [Bryobacteraceae bacterium]